MKILSLLTTAVLMTAQCQKNLPNDEDDRNLTVNTFTESAKAFPNALKGFAGPGSSSPYVTLDRQYVKWNDIETRESDGVDVIRAYSDRVFTPFAERGIKVIPRVYLCWPYDQQNSEGTRMVFRFNNEIKYCDVHWPSDMTAGDYSSEQFKDRVVKLIRKMGEAWDNDSRIAFIQMGIIGYWGEQHSPSPDYEMQQLLGNTFNEVFKNKKVMVRNYNEFTAFDFGYYWDSFAHIDQTNFLEGMVKRGEYWKTHVNGGETAYDWGRTEIQPGRNPDESLGERAHLDYLIECVRWIHTNHLGWVSIYSLDKPEVVAGAAEFQKVMGYRFVIDNARFTPNITDGKLTVSLTIRNVGSTPLYEKYPLEISLLNPMTKEKVWHSTFAGADCRGWMPGDNWNKGEKRYMAEPQTYTVREEFAVNPIPSGEYLLAVTLLDPASLKPAARFAMDNYLKGGYTVLGRIGVNSPVSDNSTSGIAFDDISAERLIP